MKCRYCGKELADGSAFCNYCGHSQTAPEQQDSTSTIAAAPQPQSEETLKCPHCGSTHLQFTTQVKTQGVSVSDACCGYVCLGPVGLLCGLCGAGSSETKDYWVCRDCGTKFTAEEARKAVAAKLREEQNLAKKQQEKEAQLAAWHSMIDNCPYPVDQLDKLYAEAVKDAEAKGKQFQNCRDKERKGIGAWQAAYYGMLVGFFILLIAVVVFLFSLAIGANLLIGILLGIVGFVVTLLFSLKDDKLFEQYASPSLRAMKEEKEKATQYKEELKKYQEAAQAIRSEESASRKDS